MSSNFKEKNANIIIIDNSGAVRQLIMNTIKNLGFTKIQGVANIKDAINIMEVEPVDWIVAPLAKEDDINGLQLLNLIISQANLKNTRVSLFFEPNESDLVPIAYEKGLFCHLTKPFNKDSFSQEMSMIVNLIEEKSWDETKVASSRLVSFLNDSKEYDSLIKFAQNIMKLYPGDCEFLLEISKAYYNLENHAQCKKYLSQALILNNGKKNEIAAVASKLFPEEEDLISKLESQTSEIDALGIKNCFVIDSDQSSSQSIKSTLNQIGVKEVNCFEDGEEAWKSISSLDEVGLIIQEWKIPSLSGPALIQRIKSKHPSVPIIIASSLLTDSDQPILQEIGIEAFIGKPLNKESLIKKIVSTIQEERVPTKTRNLELKIARLLQANHHEQAVKLKDNFLQIKDVPELRKKKIMADFAYHEGNFCLARDLALEVIKSKSDSITLLNFIGKCLMKLNDPSAALKCFEKAQELSPMNIERLCTIAKVSQDIGNADDAQAALKKAKSIDQNSDQVTETEASINITQGDSKKAQSLLENLPSLDNVISLMNNKAIAHARNGLLDKGIEIYHQTLSSIPQNKKSYLNIVNYNLALAFARAEKLENSLELIKKVKFTKNPKLKKKCLSLEKRITASLSSGKKLVLYENTSTPQDQEKKDPRKVQSKEEVENSKKQIEGNHKNIIAAVVANPGDICCYKIFFPKTSEKMLQAIQTTIPHFKSRQAIAKEVSGGLEKMMKK